MARRSPSGIATNTTTTAFDTSRGVGLTTHSLSVVDTAMKIQYVSLPDGYRVCLENPRDEDPKVAGVIVRFHKFDDYVDVMWADGREFSVHIDDLEDA